MHLIAIFIAWDALHSAFALKANREKRARKKVFLE